MRSRNGVDRLGNACFNFACAVRWDLPPLTQEKLRDRQGLPKSSVIKRYSEISHHAPELPNDGAGLLQGFRPRSFEVCLRSMSTNRVNQRVLPSNPTHTHTHTHTHTSIFFVDYTTRVFLQKLVLGLILYVFMSSHPNHDLV
jgi:hypothetical protein